MNETNYPSRARQRQRLRKQRRNQKLMAVRSGKGLPHLVQNPLVMFLRRLLRLLQQRPLLGILATTVVGLFLIQFLVTVIFTGHIAPNVTVLDIPLGGMPFVDARAELVSWWDNSIYIELRAGDRDWIVSPSDLGIQLHVQDSLEAASFISLPEIVLGRRVNPVVTLDVNTARAFLSNLAPDVFIAPVQAHYTWNGDELVGIAGEAGLSLDVEATLQVVTESAVDVLVEKRLDLVIAVTTPDVADPNILIDEAAYFIEAPLQIVGYDPFLDETLIWTTAPSILASWFEASGDGLVIRNDQIASFISAINDDLAARLAIHGATYLDLDETIAAINQSLRLRQTTAHVQIHYRSSTYQVIAGDTGYRISRRMGIPFFLLEAANPNIDLDVLSPGDVINLPSHDTAIPLAPIVNKRIIVDLETQTLVAYENRQEVFRWRISSGISSAPTSPGIYQILSHTPVAYGSSYTLCDEVGCGQWQMNWFMGIYEVIPGLVNGFHGAVLLPDGTFLGGNNVGTPYTLGCVMSGDDQARLLYDWAEVGTIVEIISDDFPPQSVLARLAFGE